MFIQWSFYLTIITIYPVVVICLWQELESMEQVKSILRNKDGEIDIRKLTLTRISFCFLVMSMTLFITDEYFLMLLSGSVFVPVFGVMGPVS